MAVLRGIFSVVLVLVLAYTMLWGALALWFKLPVSETLRQVVIAVFLVPGVFAVVHAFTRRTWRSLLVYGVLLGVVLVWWQTLTPPAEGDWSPDVARQVSGTIEDNVLTLDGVRAFEWRSPDDVTEIWETRSYDLSKLESVDLFLSYWGNPRIAHFMMSFGFGDGVHLAWSVEVRRLRTGVYSPIADFFKANPLAVVAAEEYDVVGLRSNIWENDVYIFPLHFDPAAARTLLESYLYDANLLAETPVWYNSVFTNCTTVILRTLAAFDLHVPFDWRLIVNGYLPELFHERGTLIQGYPLEDLRAAGRIADRARAVDLGAGYSEAIRVGVPRP